MHFDSFGATVLRHPTTDGADRSAEVPVETRLRWYERILDELPCAAIVKDLDGRYRYVNRRFLETYPAGYSIEADDIIGRTDAHFIDLATAADYDHKDQQVIAGHGFRELVEELRLPDGTAEFHETTKLAIHDPDGEVEGLLALSRRITEPGRSEQAYSSSERRYRLAMQSTRDGVWELDLAERKLDLSARASRLLHLPVSEEPIDATGLFEVIDDDERADFCDQLTGIFAGERDLFASRVTVALQDGSVRTLRIDATAIYEGEQATRLIGAFADITDAVENERRLRHVAEHDHLTGLANRRALLARLDDLLGEPERRHSLLYLDLDDFKLVNDSFGHGAGDELLVEVGKRLQSVAGDDDLVSRVGGDEFALLISNPRDEEGSSAACLGARVLRSLQRPIDVDDMKMFVSASIGVLDVDGYSTSEEVLRDADTAMYSAKTDKGTVHTFEADMRIAAVHRQQLNNSLRRAVRGHEFELAYQPLVDAQSRLVTSVEALLRWRPNGTPISTAEFLPALEQTGMIIDLGEWIIDEACRQLSDWHTRGLTHLTMAINLSRVQTGQQDLDEIVARSAAQHHVLPGDLTFEITETAITSDPEQLVAVLARLRQIGCKIAIDDFGVGQSCLSQLHLLPADVLKIDRSFVSRIERAEDHHDPVLEVVLQLARSLGMSTVAEGVETDDQADWLAARGCDVLQGFHFARPMFPDAIDHLIVDEGSRTASMICSI